MKRWNRKTEDLDDVTTNEEETERLHAGLATLFYNNVISMAYRSCTAGLKDMDRFLGAYPYDLLKRWVGLTQYISKNVLERWIIIWTRLLVLSTCGYHFQVATCQ